MSYKWKDTKILETIAWHQSPYGPITLQQLRRKGKIAYLSGLILDLRRHSLAGRKPRIKHVIIMDTPSDKSCLLCNIQLDIRIAICSTIHLPAAITAWL